VRALHRLQRDRGRRCASGAGEGCKHRPFGLVAPEEAGPGSRRLARKRRDLVGRPRLIGAGRQRIKRRVREERAYEKNLARLRFWLALTAVIATSVGLSLVIWNQIQRLFGL
jgi:hypothetical protein